MQDKPPLQTLQIDPGSLRHRVTILAPVTSRNAYGEEAPAWEAVAEVWANVEPLSGRKLWQAQQVVPLATTAITMRYHPAVRPDCKIRLGASEFNVVNSSDRQGLRAILDLLCTGPA